GGALTGNRRRSWLRPPEDSPRKSTGTTAGSGHTMTAMYRSVIALLGLPRLLFAADTPTAEAAPAPHQCCELRTCQAAPGKLDALHSRFRDQALPLLAHHKATVAGCWVPVENPDGK